MCTNFRSTSRSEKLRTNFRNFGRETCREREMNFRRKFREIGSCRTCTWRVLTTKMCRTQSSCENSYTFSQGLSRNFVRIFVVQNLSNAVYFRLDCVCVGVGVRARVCVCACACTTCVRLLACVHVLCASRLGIRSVGQRSAHLRPVHILHTCPYLSHLWIFTSYSSW